MFVTLGNFSSRKISENLLEVGYVSSDLVAEYFSAADLFLYPTIMDSFGLVIAESLACGCPVVTFDTG
jgi:glycosyltransferase involved in cell wall biosynthesis